MNAKPKRRRLTVQEAAKLRIIAARAAISANPENPIAAAKALPALLYACRAAYLILPTSHELQLVERAIAIAEGRS